MCNPYNTGHYKYPKFETLSYDEGCHSREVHNFLKRPDSDKYVIFYTRHTNANGEWSNKVVGYFKVGKLMNHTFGFSASECILLLKNQAIPITYTSRGVPVSWGNARVKDEVNVIFRRLMSLSKENDVSEKYRSESQSIVAMLRSEIGRKKMLETCESCAYNSTCYWGKKNFTKRYQILKELYKGEKSCQAVS
jgi:hypothetical protein